MVSLLILAVVGGWVALWVYVFRHAPNRGVRIGAVLVAVLVPFWDLPIGYFEYQRHCSSEGGVRVYEPIPPQDKIYFESTPSSLTTDMLKQGFKVVEILRIDRQGIMRQEMQDGTVRSRTVTSPESTIVISIARNESLPWNIYRDRHVARSISNNKVIASYTAFFWNGGWLEKSEIGPLFPPRLRCSTGHDPLVALLRQGS